MHVIIYKSVMPVGAQGDLEPWFCRTLPDCCLLSQPERMGRLLSQLRHGSGAAASVAVLGW